MTHKVGGMEVLLAESAGACYGVKRALDLAFSSTKDGNSAQTLGPLIHNPQVVANLEEQGISVAHTPEEITASTVVIRSHGVTPEVLDQLNSLEVTIIDATCPHVIRAQQAAFNLAQAGNTVLVIGEENHPEVQGLAAWARRGRGAVIVADSPQALPEIIPEPLGIVVQTTQSRETFDSILNALSSRGISPTIHDTICSATSKRQNAAIALAEQVDAMVIIGGKNSSNTTRLYELCSNIAPAAFHIESAEELNRSWFEQAHTVGVTAGASTPDDQIQAVVDCLRSW